VRLVPMLGAFPDLQYALLVSHGKWLFLSLLCGCGTGALRWQRRRVDAVPVIRFVTATHQALSLAPCLLRALSLATCLLRELQQKEDPPTVPTFYTPGAHAHTLNGESEDDAYSYLCEHTRMTGNRAHSNGTTR
jgi:hypothetical protein